MDYAAGGWRHGPFGQIGRIFADGGVAVLSGAGLSTDSGIPDYRGPTGLARSATPMTYQTFTGSAAARQRYWARSHLGWPHIAGARPNSGHLAVAALERAGLLTGVITQNVDGLHQAAGSDAVIELHGSLSRVRCLTCADITSRGALARRLGEANPGLMMSSALISADGDAEALGAVESFNVVGCLACGGVLKPDVVFFGENVPPDRVRSCYELVEGARALVVLGSSLAVMSGLRFVRHADRLGLPIVIVNQGPTRGDELATIRLDAPLGATLTELAASVTGAQAGGTICCSP